MFVVKSSTLQFEIKIALHKREMKNESKKTKKNRVNYTQFCKER